MPYKMHSCMNTFKITQNFIYNSPYESVVQNQLGKEEQLQKEAGKLRRPRLSSECTLQTKAQQILCVSLGINVPCKRCTMLQLCRQ